VVWPRPPGDEVSGLPGTRLRVLRWLKSGWGWFGRMWLLAG
jgi:hypothetical protein